MLALPLVSLGKFPETQTLLGSLSFWDWVPEYALGLVEYGNTTRMLQARLHLHTLRAEGTTSTQRAATHLNSAAAFSASPLAPKAALAGGSFGKILVYASLSGA